MIRPLIVAALAITVSIAGCSNAPEVGVRYRAERDFWKANVEYRQLSIRPELVSDQDWHNIAQKYEDLASTYAADAASMGPDPRSEAARDVRVLVARALMSAARVHTMRGDTTATIELYERVQSEFADLTTISAEVTYAQAQIAERAGKLDDAAAKYERIVEHIEPVAGEASIPGAVVGLPLHIARLRMQSNQGSPQAVAAYRNARKRYEEWIAKYPDTRTEVDCWARLADVAADQGDIDEAVRILRQLETTLARSKVESRDPAEARFAIAMVQSRHEGPHDSTIATLQSLVTDYPASGYAPRALLALANEAAGRDADTALAYLDRVHAEYGGSEVARSRAVLLRARVLEQHDRWHEALEAYRRLSVEHPFTEEALTAPLEIVQHHARAGEAEEKATALANAEKVYTDFLKDNPPGPLTLGARRKLLQTWVLQERYDEAIDGLVSLGDDMEGSRQGAASLIDAARIANATGDSTKAAEIVERIKTLYGDKTPSRGGAAASRGLQEATSP